MRQITVGNDVLVPIDQYLTPINIAYVASGGTVQVSYTDPFPLNAQGYPVPTAPVMTWVNYAGTSPIVDNPIRAIRITGGSGSDTLTVIQAGVR
jgi:hypothetical protein